MLEEDSTELEVEEVARPGRLRSTTTTLPPTELWELPPPAGESSGEEDDDGAQGRRDTPRVLRVLDARDLQDEASARTGKQRSNYSEQFSETKITWKVTSILCTATVTKFSTY
eukprot:SAG11_NODE_9818_length_878_cov_2.223363_2_plen_113_part_00